MKENFEENQMKRPSSKTEVRDFRTKNESEENKIINICSFESLDPHGRGYTSWLLLVTFCYGYNAWCIPVRATLPHNTARWVVADCLCDLVYLLDVALVKPRLMYLHEGFWVSSPAETRNNYRKKLQYKLGVISSIPMDLWLYLYSDKEIVWYAFLRLTRLIKFQTVCEFHQNVDRAMSHPCAVRLGKSLIYLLYVLQLHACACVYYNNPIEFDGKACNCYVRCFYSATKNMISSGKTSQNRVIGFMISLIGKIVFALLVSQIRDVIHTATRSQTVHRNMVEKCTHYLKRLNMPQSTMRKVNDWFAYRWIQQRSYDESRVLNSLPYNMKRDVALAVHMGTLAKVQLFRDCSASLLRDLVLQLRPVSFLPGDVVVRRGDVGHHMYIIKSGECCVLSPDEREVLATLQEGSVFGEISLLAIDGARRRTATVRSRGYSNLFALSKSDLDHALTHHREAAHVLRRKADQIILHNEQISICPKIGYLCGMKKPTKRG